MDTTEPDVDLRGRRRVVVVIAYFHGLKGYVSSEWTEDKITALKELGTDYVLVSAPLGPRDADALMHYQVSSISWEDFQREGKERASQASGGWNPARRTTSHLVACSLGRFLDLILRKVLGAHSDGRLSWAVAAAPVVLFLAMRYRTSTFLALGGPSSSHLLGILLGFFGVRVVAELQDPLLGRHMSISRQARALLARVEALLVRKSSNVYLTSKSAVEESHRRNPDFHEKISLMYPGIPEHKGCEKPVKFPFPLTLVHMGSLYGSRNLDQVFLAIRRIQDEFPNRKIGVLNLGLIEPELLAKYRDLDNFKVIATSSRHEAICYARGASANLLIQHLDERAKVTIPYKTFDYAAKGMPSCVVVNCGEELGTLVNQFSNFIVPVGGLEEALRQVLLGKTPSSNLVSSFPSVASQLRKMLES